MRGAGCTAPSSSAATVIAPLGSATSLCRSSRKRIARRQRGVVDRDDVVEEGVMVREVQVADADRQQAVGEAARIRRDGHRRRRPRARA